MYIGYIALIVRDYDEAIEYYTKVLGFELIADIPLNEAKRWVLVRPQGAKETCLLLAEAANPEQSAYIGNQTGNRVFLFLMCDDFWRNYELLLSKGVRFLEAPRKEAYGHVTVFEDIYGNRWDLLEKQNPAN